MVKQSRAQQLEQKCSYWKQHIDSWQEKGLTQVEYCRQHNLKHHQLVYWKKCFCQKAPKILADALEARRGNVIDLKNARK